VCSIAQTVLRSQKLERAPVRPFPILPELPDTSPYSAVLYTWPPSSRINVTLVPPSRRSHTQSHIEVTSCPYPFGSVLANLTLRFFPLRSSTSCFLHVTSQILNLPNHPLVLEAATGAGIVYRYVRRCYPHSNFVLPVLLHQTHPVVDPSSLLLSCRPGYTGFCDL
jgi:hypothetical protein